MSVVQFIFCPLIMFLFVDEIMSKVIKKVIRLVKVHPEGIPLSRLADFYNQKYCQNLTVSDAGFSSIADFIASLHEHLEVKNGAVFHKNHKPQNHDTAEEVEVAQSCPEGNFFSLSVGERVSARQHKCNLNNSKIPSLYCVLVKICIFIVFLLYVTYLLMCLIKLFHFCFLHFKNADKDKTSQEVVELVQEHPEGIPVKQLAVFYSLRYRRNLIVSNVGFASVSSFVDSLSQDLLVKKGKIFHKMHKVPFETPAPLNETPPTLMASSGKLLGAVATRKEGEMSQEELLQKVKEVIKVYPAAATSIAQLMNGYFLLFGSILPLGLYMSLYDSQTSTKQAADGPAQVIARQETGSPAST